MDAADEELEDADFMEVDDRPESPASPSTASALLLLPDDILEKIVSRIACGATPRAETVRVDLAPCGCSSSSGRPLPLDPLQELCRAPLRARSLSLSYDGCPVCCPTPELAALGGPFVVGVLRGLAALGDGVQSLSLDVERGAAPPAPPPAPGPRPANFAAAFAPLCALTEFHLQTGPRAAPDAQALAAGLAAAVAARTPRPLRALTLPAASPREAGAAIEALQATAASSGLERVELLMWGCPACEAGDGPPGAHCPPLEALLAALSRLPRLARLRLSGPWTCPFGPRAASLLAGGPARLQLRSLRLEASSPLCFPALAALAASFDRLEDFAATILVPPDGSCPQAGPMLHLRSAELAAVCEAGSASAMRPLIGYFSRCPALETLQIEVHSGDDDGQAPAAHAPTLTDLATLATGAAALRALRLRPPLRVGGCTPPQVLETLKAAAADGGGSLRRLEELEMKLVHAAGQQAQGPAFGLLRSLGALRRLGVTLVSDGDALALLRALAKAVPALPLLESLRVCVWSTLRASPAGVSEVTRAAGAGRVRLAWAMEGEQQAPSDEDDDEA
eukprot:tig00020830_g14460.t1